MAIINLVDSFKLKYRLDLPDEEIYIFDDEYNNEIREKFTIMYETKIYMIACSFIWLVGMLSQFALIILNLKIVYSKKKNNKNNNLNTNRQDVFVFQDTERQKNISEVAENTNQAILHNKNSSNNKLK